jgi:NADH-quinone oxidoreductase subunit C
MANPYDYQASPNRQITAPKTVPLPSHRQYVADQQALAAADEAKWQKQLADFEVASAKAAAEGKEAPKAPVKAVPKKDDNDMAFPAPRPATDADLLRLRELLGDKVEELFEQGDQLTCQVDRHAILEALRLVKSDPQLRFEMLADETATHYPAATDFAFSVVYHLTSVSRHRRLRLRILIPAGFEPESATQVYGSANWLEREIFDMLGVRFQNHPDLTRILCPDDWEGHPLLKDYPVVGWGQRDVDFREDRSGMLNKIALEKAGYLGINLKPPRAD